MTFQPDPASYEPLPTVIVQAMWVSPPHECPSGPNAPTHVGYGTQELDRFTCGEEQWTRSTRSMTVESLDGVEAATQKLLAEFDGELPAKPTSRCIWCHRDEPWEPRLMASVEWERIFAWPS